MKKLISLITVCLLLLGLCGCERGPSLVGTTPTGDQASDDSASNSSKTFKPGDSVELNDVVVTFIGVEETNDSDFNKPAEGKVYVLCEFEIVNNGNEDLTVSTMLNFEAYCDDYGCDLSIGALMERGSKEQLDGTAAAGKKIKGVVGYEIPADWKELEVHYSPGIFTSDKIVFVATNN